MTFRVLMTVQHDGRSSGKLNFAGPLRWALARGGSHGGHGG